MHVAWAIDEITSRFPNFEFVRVDAANARYNPVGADDRRLPVDDMLCAFSVVSHMLSDDTRTYLAEIRRVVHPDGRAYITAYVAEHEPDETENRPGSARRPAGCTASCTRGSI